tara:strand:+ start:11737 stop:11889 length:153 start_codon:yes stop_codon:yes gene_type:complete
MGLIEWWKKNIWGEKPEDTTETYCLYWVDPEPDKQDDAWSSDTKKVEWVE